jgi:ParB family chromosome partitioning protein
MAEKSGGQVRRALGKGLESLLPASSRNTPAPRPETSASDNSVAGAAAEKDTSGAGLPFRTIPIALIDRNPYQTRKHVDEEALAELAKSIAQHGLMQPINVRPIADGRFQIVGGERRFLAVQQLGHDSIVAHVEPATDENALLLTIIENLQREDLNPMEQARGFGRLVEEFQYIHDEISRRTGKNRSTVTNYTRLLHLPEEVQVAVEDGRLTMGHAKALLGLRDKESMSAVAFKVLTQELSVRKTEELVNHVQHGSPKKVEKPAPPVDPNVREAQEQLQRVLALKVTIEDRNGKGRVIIEYTDLDDFEVLMNTFGQRSKRRD